MAREEQRVALYARVSTKDPILRNAAERLRSYCEGRGYAQVSEFIDNGFSGSKDSRPALDLLMDSARKGRIDLVLRWRFDRFARSTKHLLSALEEFRSLGVQFVSFSENMGTGSALGQAIFTIVAAVAQLERDLIRERVTAGVRNARAKGKVLGRPKKIVDRAKLYALADAGTPLCEIASRMNLSYGAVRERLSERKSSV